MEQCKIRVSILKELNTAVECHVLARGNIRSKTTAKQLANGITQQLLEKLE